jgi:NAD(P)-dependent dehydrogenase (short-subunit alcohol dehydrogenase family)
MLDGKVIIVTGAAGNVGSALALLLAERGARVVAVDRTTERLPALLGDSAALMVGAEDLTDPSHAEQAVAQALTLGRLDGVANTVGGFAYASLADSGPELFQQMFRINVLTTLNLIRAAMPAMTGGGSIVAIAAGAALRGPANMSAYAAAKAGLLRLIESTAEEGKAAGIRASAVLPGVIDTPQNRAAMGAADAAKWVTPREVAEAIAFLLSDASSGVSGAALAVPGRT